MWFWLSVLYSRYIIHQYVIVRMMLMMMGIKQTDCHRQCKVEDVEKNTIEWNDEVWRIANKREWTRNGIWFFQFLCALACFIIGFFGAGMQSISNDNNNTIEFFINISFVAFLFLMLYSNKIRQKKWITHGENMMNGFGDFFL